MKDDCIFCKIVKSEIKISKIYEDKECFAILDKFPATEGQTLVITKKHYPYILDVEDNEYSHIFKIAKKIANALDKTFKPERTCFVVEGFHVPHVHIKLYPVKEKHLVLTGTRELSDLEAIELSDKIRKIYNGK